MRDNHISDMAGEGPEWRKGRERVKAESTAGWMLDGCGRKWPIFKRLTVLKGTTKEMIFL